MPLFVGSVEEASDGWMYWLLDSGAACSVLAEQNKECYKRVSRGRDVSGRYLAANGTPVQMGEKVLASVLFAVERSDGTQDSQEFQLECNIGQTAHNIISTTQLMKKGWTLVQSNSGSFLVHEPTKTFIGEVLYWGSCRGYVLPLMVRQECLRPEPRKPFRQLCLEMVWFRSHLR